MPLILGIDPGSKYTGYGLVTKEGTGLRFVAAGRIAARAKDPLADRLRQIFQGLRDVIQEFQPDVAAAEDVFYAKNVRSAVRLGHVRGVALLAAAESGLIVHEYPPASVKMSVTGFGRADKAQVALMVNQILGLNQKIPEDASDALAVAICHANQSPALTGK